MGQASRLPLVLALLLGADAFVEGDGAEPTPVQAPVTGPPLLGIIPPAVLDAARAAHHLPLPERMKAVSEPLLDAPYVADPLGEGAGVDHEPFARYDVFDCLTFIEEVLALSLAADPEHSAPVRLDLRYGGAVPSYATRHHFMELQWIPSAIARGWVADTTARYGEVVHLHKDVDLATWKGWGRRARFAHTDDELPVGAMDLDVLPLEDAIARAGDIAPGTIVLTVRTDRAGVPIWITHVGFTIPADEPTVRHATRLKSGLRVRDHGLRWYLEHLRGYSNWPALGVALLQPIEQGPRLVRRDGMLAGGE